MVGARGRNVMGRVLDEVMEWRMGNVDEDRQDEVAAVSERRAWRHHF